MALQVGVENGVCAFTSTTVHSCTAVLNGAVCLAPLLFPAGELFRYTVDARLRSSTRGGGHLRGVATNPSWRALSTHLLREHELLLDSHPLRQVSSARPSAHSSAHSSADSETTAH